MQATCARTYPAGVFGQNGTLRVAEVPVDCPPLFSVKSMTELGVCLDIEKGVTRMSGLERPIQSMENGHPKLRIDDYDWNSIHEFSERYWLNDTQYHTFCVEDATVYKHSADGTYPSDPLVSEFQICQTRMTQGFES